MKSNNVTRFAAKIAVGGLLIFYMLNKKMIDFHAVRDLVLSPGNILAALFFFTFSTACISLRWFLLARAQGLTLSLKDTFELTMIGNFFNTFMPGAVGGDVVKAWYVAGNEPKRRTRAVFTVLLDRAIGLSVFFFYSATTLLFYTAWLEGRPQLKVLAVAVWGFSGAALVFGTLFYTPVLWKLKPFTRLLELLHRSSFLAKVLDAAMLYRNHFFTICVAFVISALSIFTMTLYYKIMGDALGIPMELAKYCFIIPIALTASAIPLLPGGVGVAQVAFSQLFLWVGAEHPDQGGTLCTAVQIYNILFNCLGAIFYLKFKRKPEAQGTPMKGDMLATGGAA